VSLLNAYGAVVSTGGALLSGTGTSGLDALNPVPGLYTLKVTDLPGLSRPVDCNVIFTRRVP